MATNYFDDINSNSLYDDAIKENKILEDSTKQFNRDWFDPCKFSFYS